MDDAITKRFIETNLMAAIREDGFRRAFVQEYSNRWLNLSGANINLATDGIDGQW